MTGNAEARLSEARLWLGAVAALADSLRHRQGRGDEARQLLAHPELTTPTGTGQ